MSFCYIQNRYFFKPSLLESSAGRAAVGTKRRKQNYTSVTVVVPADHLAECHQAYLLLDFVNFDRKNNNNSNYQRPISGHQLTRFGTHHQFKVLSG